MATRAWAERPGVASVAINLQFGKVFNVTPFNGGKNLRADVLGGRCEVGIFSQSEILANRDVLEPLAILYQEHSQLDYLKTVPTLEEIGLGALSVPGGSFKSIAVRKGTPAEVQGILADAFEKAFNSDLYQSFMKETGVIPAFTKLSDTKSYFDKLVEGFEPVIREAGLYRKK